MELLHDWQVIITTLRHWLSGGDPYTPYTLYQRQISDLGGAFAYPPPLLALGAPLTVLPWYISGLLITLLSIIAFECWVRQSSGRIGFWLLLWLPLTQGLWIGQLTLLALLGLLFAERASAQQQDRRAGILLALAILKPQAVVLPAAWLLLQAGRQHRWRLLGAFLLTSALLWGGMALLEGPGIYLRWVNAARLYSDSLPNRPLLFPPFGPLLGALAGLLWWRHGRGDVLGLALLLNTLVYPLSVIYVASGVLLVVIRWRRDLAVYPLLLSWLIPMFIAIERTPDSIAGLTQSIIATGLLAGLLPRLPLSRWLSGLQLTFKRR